MTYWVRLWDDMPTDPKWRVIARRSGRSISEVIAVFTFMLVNAGANASERNGTLKNWDDEDIAAALDLLADDVALIREAMQGKTLDGEKLTGWDRRQPKREDGAADRAKAWRERKKSIANDCERDNERNRTQQNAEERPDSETDEDSEKSLESAPKRAAPSKGTRLPNDWKPEPWPEGEAMVGRNRYAAETLKFSDYWRAKAGKDATKTDWQATWRNWIRRVAEPPGLFQQQPTKTTASKPHARAC